MGPILLRKFSSYIYAIFEFDRSDCLLENFQPIRALKFSAKGRQFYQYVNPQKIEN